MLKQLLKKELSLATHPTAIIFLAFAALVFVPNYPYEVIFFFSCLSIYFITLQGRENKDLFFTCLLPVSKTAVVKSKIFFTVILQCAQITLLAIMIVLKCSLMPTAVNIAGLEGNLALIGVGFTIFGVFNIIFFPCIFKRPNSIGKPFVAATVAIFIIIAIMSILCFVAPPFRDYIDNIEPSLIGYRAIVLCIGVVLYAALTAISLKLSIANFDNVNL